MRFNKKWMFVVMILTCLQLTACEREDNSAENGSNAEPGRVEEIAGTNVKRVILTPDAVRRIELKMSPVQSTLVNGVQRKTVPYSTILYDFDGKAWVYKNIAPNAFMRTPVVIEAIQGDIAILSDGPPEGTQVVSVGASELFGTEFLGTIES